MVLGIIDGTSPDEDRDRFEDAWQFWEEAGFSVYEVSYLALALDAESGNQALVVKGDLQFESIREELEVSLNYRDSEYRGYESWEGLSWRGWDWKTAPVL